MTEVVEGDCVPLGGPPRKTPLQRTWSCENFRVEETKAAHSTQKWDACTQTWKVLGSQFWQVFILILMTFIGNLLGPGWTAPNFPQTWDKTPYGDLNFFPYTPFQWIKEFSIDILILNQYIYQCQFWTHLLFNWMVFQSYLGLFLIPQARLRQKRRRNLPWRHLRCPEWFVRFM